MGDPEQIKQYDMQILETKIVNIHGKIDDPENTVPEMQQLVVGAHSMPKEEWSEPGPSAGWWGCCTSTRSFRSR